jgi:hypothetical protein
MNLSNSALPCQGTFPKKSFRTSILFLRTGTAGGKAGSRNGAMETTRHGRALKGHRGVYEAGYFVFQRQGKGLCEEIENTDVDVKERRRLHNKKKETGRFSRSG